MIILITEVKERVNIIDVLTAYGMKIFHNKTRCPFHNEDTPSFTVYSDTNSFYCFGCGTGGDPVTFVQKYFNLEPLQAAQKLNEDFRLGLAGQALTYARKRELAAEIRRREERNKLLAAYEEWERGYYIRTCDRIKVLEDLIEALRPRQLEDISDVYAALTNELQLLEYHWDILFNGGFEDKLALYHDTNRREDIVKGKRHREDNGFRKNVS